MGDDLIDFYDTYKERICTFHFKDTADSDGVADEIRYAKDVEICDDGHRWFWEPGEGTLPMEELWKHIADYGFKGWEDLQINYMRNINSGRTRDVFPNTEYEGYILCIRKQQVIYRI